MESRSPSQSPRESPHEVFVKTLRGMSTNCMEDVSCHRATKKRWKTLLRSSESRSLCFFCHCLRIFLFSHFSRSSALAMKQWLPPLKESPNRRENIPLYQQHLFSQMYVLSAMHTSICGLAQLGPRRCPQAVGRKPSAPPNPCRSGHALMKLASSCTDECHTKWMAKMTYSKSTILSTCSSTRLLRARLCFSSTCECTSYKYYIAKLSPKLVAFLPLPPGSLRPRPNHARPRVLNLSCEHG